MAAVKAGDMVVIDGGRIGLLFELSKGHSEAGVMFVQNGDLEFFSTESLRRATRQEVDASPLKGVGCNQAYDA